MALWGNNDNIGSLGTVTLNYATRVVTGAGTSFSNTGAAQVGDVIRFGDPTGTYFGDAMIVSIASTVSCTIGSTQGLNGNAISGAQYQVTQIPQYTVQDESFSERLATDATATTLPFGKLAGGVAGVSTDIVPVKDANVEPPIIVGDLLVNGGSDIVISTVTADQITLGSTISTGISTNDPLTFKRLQNGYDKYTYGVAEVGTEDANSGQYKVAHAGWVGVTTYIDNAGQLRVKSEVLVAASGITTGNPPVYPPA